MQPRLWIAPLLCVLALPGLLPAAAKPAAPAAHRRAAAQTGPSDAELEKAIRARLAASKISTNHFTVHVQGGVATLEGQTGVIQHKGTATRLAKSAGALRVVNHIQISQEARQKAAANLAKGRRRAQLKRSEVTQRTERSQPRQTR